MKQTQDVKYKNLVRHVTRNKTLQDRFLGKLFAMTNQRVTPQQDWQIRNCFSSAAYIYKRKFHLRIGLLASYTITILMIDLY
jgi:hypothetical protein